MRNEEVGMRNEELGMILMRICFLWIAKRKR